jgi:Zn finger protein HypA/HybF involved in hydrogenase expression
MQADVNTTLAKPAVCVCECCGWDWTPRYFEKPKRCPNCNSPRWDIGPASEEERVRKFKESMSKKKKKQQPIEQVVSLEVK